MRPLHALPLALSLMACAAPTTYALPSRSTSRARVARGGSSGSAATAATAEPFSQRGAASYYSDRLAGNTTANGETYDPEALTAAHRTLRFGTRVRVVREGDGRSVEVCVNDRGPYVDGRVIDLSRAAAETLGMIRAGVVDVSIEVVGSTGSRRCE